MSDTDIAQARAHPKSFDGIVLPALDGLLNGLSGSLLNTMFSVVLPSGYDRTRKAMQENMGSYDLGMLVGGGLGMLGLYKKPIVSILYGAVTGFSNIADIENKGLPNLVARRPMSRD